MGDRAPLVRGFGHGGLDPDLVPDLDGVTFALQGGGRGGEAQDLHVDVSVAGLDELKRVIIAKMGI